jgi:hypothetical protein
MTSANVVLVRSICTARERGDLSSTEWADPQIEFVIADGPAPARWQGLDGLAHSWRDFLAAWEDARQDTEGYRELDDEPVLVLTHIRGRGRASGVEAGKARTRGGGQAGCSTSAMAR